MKNLSKEKHSQMIESESEVDDEILDDDYGLDSNSEMSCDENDSDSMSKSVELSKGKSNVIVEDAQMNSSNSDMDNEISDEDCEKDSNTNNSDDENYFQPQKSKENPAWADAMAKILKTNKPKRRKTIVLSRAKRANEVKTEVKEEKLDFEIEGEGEGKSSNIKVEAVKEDIKDEPQIKRLKKKDWAGKGHVKPEILEKGREKALAKIATRGVVQLFNAVREHQKTLKQDLEDAGPVEHKKDKVLKALDKRTFLDVLMGPAKSQSVNKTVPEVKEENDNPTWSILRDDFMMSSKLKDWDKQDVEEVKEEH